jgi:hypothetical protein
MTRSTLHSLIDGLGIATFVFVAGYVMLATFYMAWDAWSNWRELRTLPHPSRLGRGSAVTNIEFQVPPPVIGYWVYHQGGGWKLRMGMARHPRWLERVVLKCCFGITWEDARPEEFRRRFCTEDA